MAEEPKCPSCGRELRRDEDPLGVTYQCIAHDCMEMFREDEIIEDMGDEDARYE